MGYIGQSPQIAQSTYQSIDDISSSFDGSTTSFALQVGGVSPVPFPIASENCLISVGGVIQEPDGTGTNGFQLTGTNIVFSAAPASGQSFFGVILAGADYVTAGHAFPDGDAAAPSITFSQDLDTGVFRAGSGALGFGGDGSEHARLDGSGQLGIGTTSPNHKLTLATTSTNTFDAFNISSGNTNSTGYQIGVDSSGNVFHWNTTNSSINFAANNSEKMRIAANGRVGIGTDSPLARTHLDGTDNGTDNLLFLTAANLASGAGGKIAFGGNYDGTNRTSWADIKGSKENGTSGEYGGYLSFTTRPNGGSNTERLRLAPDGLIGLQGATSDGGVTSGKKFYMATNGHIYLAVNNDIPVYINRNDSDGQLIQFRQANTQEGNISVSGSTVSYNGAHLSRLGQLEGGAERIEILRGSVLSNLDEMCEWAYEAQDAVLYTEEDELPEGVSVGDVKTPAVAAGTEDNEQLNRMKVSDVEGDPNVSGVFQAWDDDDDVYTNDFYCAMTGDFVIRIKQGTAVSRGDLLMSAGDGTAKPQDDDIVRSKTIAKVTSTTVSTTYSDGSYCVPCVLMAC